MSSNQIFEEQPICVLCGLQLNADDRLPCTQRCQHSICIKCIEKSSQPTIGCPKDKETITLSKEVNRALLMYLAETDDAQPRSDKSTSISDAIFYFLEEFAIMLKLDLQNKTPNISPQLRRCLLSLVESTFIFNNSARFKYLLKLSSVFNRLLLELIQAHFNSKERKEAFRRLVCSKGCTIDNPKLTDAVIESIVKPFKDANQSVDTSLERKLLINFVWRDLKIPHGDLKTKKQVERIIQTLYKSECFHVIKRDALPSKLKLKKELCDCVDLRLKHDVGLIKLAQETENRIRLSPESWAFLLYNRSFQEDLSRLQSILDKYQTDPTVPELEDAIKLTGDKYGMSKYLEILYQIETFLSCSQPDVAIETVYGIVERLYQAREIFILRQCRAYFSSDTEQSAT